ATLCATDSGQAAGRAGTHGSAQRALRFERPPCAGRNDGPRQTAAGGCPSQTARRNDLGEAGGDEPGPDPRPEPLSEGVLSVTAPQPSGGRLCLSALLDRRDQAAGRAGPQAVHLDFDLPDHFLAEFPPAIYLIQRTDLGDVSQGKLVSLTNYYQMFNGILTPRQLEGLRLLLTPFPQQQFNATEDRRAELPSQGAACFDCHSNGHQNGATHEAPDARPQWFRHRIKTISLRGLNVQRLFGSQRALKTVEDFTEFEQRTAYFDGDIVEATKKGVNPLERGSQVDFMADFQEMLDFAPAPKLDVFGKLDPGKATQAEMRGQEVFLGKGQCAGCHQPPFYTDNLMHDLHTERFFKPVMINNMMAVGDGPIKTFALRGVKDNPPYMHDGRLLTLEDTVEFFNLILGIKLAP